MWPTDVMSVSEVNDEGLPLDTTVNTWPFVLEVISPNGEFHFKL
jgi:hypothetical protein